MDQLANLPQYITETSAKGTVGSYISLGILAFVAFYALTGLLFGLKRGFGKFTIRFITIVASAVISFVVLGLANNALVSWCDGKTLEQAISEIYPDYVNAVDEGTRNIIASFDLVTAQYIILLVAALVIFPIAFLLCFVLLNFILFIVAAIISLICGFSSWRKSGLSTLTGGIIGLAQGLLISFVVLVPITGITRLATGVRAELTEGGINESNAMVDEMFTWFVDDFADNPLLAVVDSLGGDKLYGEITKITVEGNSYDARTVVYDGFEVYDVGVQLWGADFNALNAEDKAKLDRIGDILTDNGYTAGLISGLLRGVANAVDNGAVGLPMDEPYLSIVKKVVHIFADSSVDNLGGDVDTILDSYYVLSDSGILSAFTSDSKNLIADRLIAKENGKTVIDRLTEVLRANPRTSVVVDALAQLSVTIMSEQLGLGENADQLYTEVKEGLTDVLAINKSDYADEAEYKEAVTESLDSTLKDNGIALEADIVAEMADYITENYADTSEITDEDINNAILSYYDAYAEYLANKNSTGEGE